MDWNLKQNIGFYWISIPLGILLRTFILLKLVDWAEDAWKNNNRKKKWLVCFLVSFYFVLKSLPKELLDGLGL